MVTLSHRHTLLIVSAWALALSASAADWPFYRGLKRDGQSPETGFVKSWGDDGPPIAWRADVGIGGSTVVVADGRAFTMGNKDDTDIVSCLDPETGKVIWTHEYPCEFEKRMFEGGTAGTPTVDQDRVYTASYDGQVFCLAADTGKVIWKRHLIEDFGGKLSRWKYATSPLVVRDMVILDTGGQGNSTVALNKTTGEKVWGSGKDAAGYSTAIPFRQSGKDAVMLFKAEHMVAYDLASGRELWRIPWETQYNVNASTPTVLEGAVVISAGYKTGRASLFRLTDDDPKEVWTNEELKTRMSSVVVHEGAVYGITEMKARLLCLDLETGDIAWEQRGFGQYGTLLIADDTIIALSDGGELILAEANSDRYRELARAQILEKRCWIHPVLANGLLYCKNNDGALVCVDLRAP